MTQKEGAEKFQIPDRSRTRELYAAARPACEEALRGFQLRVRELLEQHEFFPTIKYRVKRFEDFYEKLLRVGRKRKGPVAITDLLGLRIICPFLEDLSTVERLLRTHFEVVEVERKTSGHSFREFGYDSVHLLVRLEESGLERIPHAPPVCEVQLRTTLQDAWAEVEHELVYKSRLTFPNESIRRKLAALNATLTLSDLIFQEIRDYQKGVLAMARKRRSALESALALPEIDWPPASGDPQPAEEAPPVAHGSPLEKAMLQALEVHSRHRFDQAVELYSRILGMRLNRRIRSLIYNHRGMAQFALGRSGEALKDFTRAIEYDQDNLRARCNRGLVLRMQKRLAQALADYDAALDGNPCLAEAWLGRAQTYLEMEFPDRALADCDKALEINPASAAAQELKNRIRRDSFRA